MMTRGAMLWMLLGLLLTTLGCGSHDPQAQISGAVAFDGEPIRAGMISFESTAAAGPPRNAPIRDGHYRATLTPGSYLVRITASVSPQPSPGSIEDAIHDAQEYVPLLPQEWNRYSKLTVDVQPGATTVNFRGNVGESPTIETGS